MTRRFGEDHPLEEKNSYKEFVERLVLNNKIQYSDVPYHLRVHNLALFYYAVRVARDHLQDAAQFVVIDLKLFMGRSEDGVINNCGKAKQTGMYIQSLYVVL